MTLDAAARRAVNRAATGRDVCARCRRPQTACYCAHIEPIETVTRLVLLQHPRERYVAIGTAYMASLCLVNSELHVGIDWDGSSPLARALSNTERPPILLYPGEGATDIVEDPPPGPVTLVVVDGTWSQTKKLVKDNPGLGRLPRYAFVPKTPSEYRIRREPDFASVSTIEALVHALRALEGVNAERFDRLLAPFRAMIDHQIACQNQFHGARNRHKKRRERPRRLRVPRVLTERYADVVCVAAEASSWPYTMRGALADDGTPLYKDDLVLWAAHRPSTGETFAKLVAPVGALAPSTCRHTGIDEPLLRAGGTIHDMHDAWNGFTRPGDVYCAWGRYETDLFAPSGPPLTPAVDLRVIARDVENAAVGSLEEYRARLGGRPDIAVDVVGRAGRKLTALTGVVSELARIGNGERDLSPGEEDA